MSPQEPPSVAIVVVNYNGGLFLKDLAASLANLSYPHSSLWLVDNASTDGSDRNLTELFPEAHVIRNQRNLGLAPAINQALALCLQDDAVEYVLLLNPDTTQEPDFLDWLVRRADQLTLVVPKVLSPEMRLANHAGGFDWSRGLLVDTHDGEASAQAMPREVQVGSFSCMLIPVQAFRAVGPLDERLALYYEDTDFCARVRRAGFRIRLQPAAIVYHNESASSGGLDSPFRHYYASRNRPYVVRKHAGAGRYALFSLYYLTTRLLQAAEYARGGRWPLLRAHLLATRDFYLGRTGMTYQPSDLNPPLNSKE